MRFAISGEHLSFFSKNHFVEFENLLSQEEVAVLRQEIDRVLSHRLDTSCEGSAWDYFLSGRDLWRESDTIKRFSLSRNFAEIAFSLTQKKPIRIAYDQCIKTPSCILEKNYFEKNYPLKNISSFQDILCGLILRISEETDGEESLSFSIGEDLEILTPLPQKPGNGMFISPEIPLDLNSILKLPNQNHLLIVYTGDPALYIEEKNDPLAHVLKKWGYGYGDKLQNATHPILLN